jgi:hypothetical protein
MLQGHLLVFRQVAKIGFGSLILICSPHQEFTEETMKELAMTIMALLLTGAMMFICSPDANAGRGGRHGRHRGWHHGGYYRGFWGYGPGMIGIGNYVIEDECYLIKRCRINQFGERRCRLEQVCP